MTKIEIPFGLSRDCTYVSKDVMKSALKNSKGVPLIDYRKTKLGITIGASTKNIEFDEKKNAFIGEFHVWNKDNTHTDLKQDVSFSIVESHEEDGVTVLDEIKIHGMNILKD